MQSFDGFNYTKDQIINALHITSASKDMKFRYDLLDYQENKIGELDTVIPGGEISQSSFSKIKRSLNFSLRDNGNINWLSDRIQPICLLKIGIGWIEVPMGIFVPTCPERVESNRSIYRDVTAYDGLYILTEDKFDDWYPVTAGTNYITAVINILSSSNIIKYNLEQTYKTLPITKVWKPGTTKLEAINELLNEIAYTELWVNETGFYTSSRYRLPSERTVEYIYKTDNMSIIKPGTTEQLDIFSVPNKIIRVSVNAESAPMKSVKTNINTNSKVSYQARGNRWIVDYEEIKNIADQESLDLIAEKALFEKTQIYGDVNFPTSINPFHSYMDVIELTHNILNVSEKFIETDWIIPLSEDGTMQHQIRAVNV